MNHQQKILLGAWAEQVNAKQPIIFCQTIQHSSAGSNQLPKVDVTCQLLERVRCHKVQLACF